MSDDKNDVLAGLVGLGIIAITVTGLYKVLKGIGSYRAGQTLTENQANCAGRNARTSLRSD